MCFYIHFLNTFPGTFLWLCICPTCVSYFLWLILTVLIKIYPLSWLWVMSPLAHFQQRCGLGLLYLILQGRPLEGLVPEAWPIHLKVLLTSPPRGSSQLSFCGFINLYFPSFPFSLPPFSHSAYSESTRRRLMEQRLCSFSLLVTVLKGLVEEEMEIMKLKWYLYYMR